MRPRFCFRTRLLLLLWMIACQFPLPVVHSHETLRSTHASFRHHLRIHHSNHEIQPLGLHLHWMMPGELTADASLACNGTDAGHCPLHRNAESTPGVIGWWTASDMATSVSDDSVPDTFIVHSIAPLQLDGIVTEHYLPTRISDVRTPQSFAASFLSVPACALLCTSQR